MDKFGLYHIVKEVPFTAPCVANLPKTWKKADKVLAGLVSSGACYTLKKSNLLVISSLATMEDGKNYLHVSCSLSDRIPNWDMLKTIKERFIGKNRDAFIYFPIDKEYVNVMPYCLHLWSEWEAE